MSYWSAVFKSGADQRAELIEFLVARRVSIDAVIMQFQPDLETVRMLDVAYRPLLSPDQLEPLLRHYLLVGECAASEHVEEDAAPLWSELSEVHLRLGQTDRSLRCLRRAAAGRPDDYALRSRLGMRLLEGREYSEAEMHLKWCAQHKPEDEAMQELLGTVMRRRADSEVPASASRPAIRR